MRKNKIKVFPAKPAIVLIILLALFFIPGYIWKSITRAPYFRIKEVISRDINIETLSYLKGKNIFALDLELEAKRISANFSDCFGVKLVRILPDRVFVDFTRRQPAALIKLYKDFYLDDSGVIFSRLQSQEELALPVIAGLERRIPSPKLGAGYIRFREISFALSLIKEIKANKVLDIFELKKIDMASLVNTEIFLLKNNVEAKLPGSIQNVVTAKPVPLKLLEIKFGAGNVKNKVDILAGLIASVGADINNIKYIDLRFKEPVIKFEDAKSK